MRGLVKVCGIHPGRTSTDVADSADLLGFIFYNRSPRFVDENNRKAIGNYGTAAIVGVFVNEDPDVVISMVERYDLTYVQLHGDESPVYCSEVREKVKVIKALAVGSGEDIARAKDYQEVADLILFDTKGESRGGTGRTFNWDLINDYEGPLGFILSGGIGPESLPDIENISHPRLVGIDLNSRFEISPGKKDIGLLKDFIQKLRHHG